MNGLVERIEEYIRYSDVTRPRSLLTGRKYLKDDMVYEIGAYIESSRDFCNKLYNTVTKEELKKSYYGIICVNNRIDFPKFVSSLTEVLERTFAEYKRKTQRDDDFDINWFKVAFFAGLWDAIQDYNHSSFKSFSIDESNRDITPYDLIKRGYDVIHKKYAVRRSSGFYTRKENLKVPGSQFFRIKANGSYEILTDDISKIIELFSVEKKIDNKNLTQKLSEKLNSVNDNVLKIATLLYGENLVNKYKNPEQNNLNETTNNIKKAKKRKPRNINQMPLFKELC